MRLVHRRRDWDIPVRLVPVEISFLTGRALDHRLVERQRLNLADSAAIETREWTAGNLSVTTPLSLPRHGQHGSLSRQGVVNSGTNFSQISGFSSSSIAGGHVKFRDESVIELKAAPFQAVEICCKNSAVFSEG